MVLLLYFLFFLSGAAGLVYEVTWVRSLSLVFGGSHLAVTTVLSVFMGGLALGSWLIGRRVDRLTRPLWAYGLLETGVAAFALGFAALVRLYPVLYPPLARLGEASPLWLSSVRVVFSAAAMIVPATLMGGTLPVLSRLVASRAEGLGRHLALLYGFNTLGAVAGSLAAGFVLLRRFGVTGTLGFAVATNIAVGLAAWALPERAFFPPHRKEGRASGIPTEDPDVPEPPSRLLLWGIGISGFCALGYEVLWTRVLSVVVGTSVYSFTIMLVAFLAGIALGSQALALSSRLLGAEGRGFRRPLFVFALVQAGIGTTAIATTYALRSLPLLAARIEGVLALGAGEFAARQGTAFVLAFAFMSVPAFFMGVAVPLAGVVHAGRRPGVGAAVGEILAFNTVGAIFGAAGSGFVLIYLLGVERSLLALAAANIAVALAVAASCFEGAPGRIARGVALAAAGSLMVIVALAPEWTHMWDRKFFAVFRNNQRGVFDTPERVRDALQNTDVLYYHEGINETISVIRPKRGAQAFVVNGRSEATTHPEDIQCQRTLGHLPMLAHPRPRKVFVLGLGTGMTLGATSIHPEVERITLAEIERGVFGAARTFGEYNHHVLDSPKLRIVHDDGRNYLRTTAEKFDVITADPIHPWSGGASYLYTTEYFREAAEHLSPGGVICQWLPIYELATRDVRSVVRTFAESFRHVALWLTYYDAELLGSNEPLRFDEAALTRRFADPEIARDLEAVDMGTPRDFLSYRISGDAGVRAFGRGGVRNTDDNLWLEFSSPRSQGIAELMGENVEALAACRESEDRVGRRYDRAHALALWSRFDDPEFRTLLDGLRRDAPGYAPARFLERRYETSVAATPRPLEAARFDVAEEGGRRGILDVTAVAMRVGEDRGVVVFVDNSTHTIYGQRYLDARDAELFARLASLAREVLTVLRAEHAELEREASARGHTLPDREAVVSRLRSRVAQLTDDDSALAP